MQKRNACEIILRKQLDKYSFTFYNNNVKGMPISGCIEIITTAGYDCDGRKNMFDKVKELDAGYGHLVLLCKNNEGYNNMIKIV